MKLTLKDINYSFETEDPFVEKLVELYNEKCQVNEQLKIMLEDSLDNCQDMLYIIKNGKLPPEKVYN